MGLFQAIQAANQAKLQLLQQQRQADREEAAYYEQVMSDEQATRALLLKPSLPLVEEKRDAPRKTSTIGFTLKVRPGGNNDHTYKKTIGLFSEGTPHCWLETMRSIKEVWTQNGLNGAMDRASVVRAVLRDDALTQFDSALESSRAGRGAAQLVVGDVESALNAVSSAVFPYRALEIQKLWMRRHMKKPKTMSYRSLQAKILQINGYLPFFPDASATDKFSERELLEILEFALPAHWRTKFDLDGYVPTDHDRARLLRESEAMERKEPGKLADKVPRKPAKKKQKKSKDSSHAKHGTKYCSEHGWGTHGSSECGTLHPDLKPEKFKTSGEKKAKAKAKNATKETNVLVKEMVQTQLQELLANFKPNKKKNSSKTRSRKRSVLFAESDSDESAHEMEVETPDASNMEGVADKVQKFVAETIEIDK